MPSFAEDLDQVRAAPSAAPPSFDDDVAAVRAASPLPPASAASFVDDLAAIRIASASSVPPPAKAALPVGPRPAPLTPAAFPMMASHAPAPVAAAPRVPAAVDATLATMRATPPAAVPVAAAPAPAAAPPLRPGRMAGLADTAPRSTTTTPLDVASGMLQAPIGILQALPSAAGEQRADTTLPGHEGEPSTFLGRAANHLRMILAGKGGAVGGTFTPSNPPDTVAEPSAAARAIAEKYDLPAPAPRVRGHAEQVVLELANRGAGLAAKMLQDPMLVAMGVVTGTAAEALALVNSAIGVQSAVETATNPQAKDVDVAESVVNALLMAVPVGAHALRQARTRVSALADEARTSETPAKGAVPVQPKTAPSAPSAPSTAPVSPGVEPADLEAVPPGIRQQLVKGTIEELDAARRREAEHPPVAAVGAAAAVEPPAVDVAPAHAAEPAPRRDYSSTQITLTGDPATRLQQLAQSIPDEHLAKDGREDTPHVTVKFGLHTNDVDAVRQVLADEGPIRLTLGKTSMFPNGESGSGDVVKVDVDSPDLHRLNQKLAAALPNTDTHPTYVPHATVAYVKPGQGEAYVGRTELEGQQVVADHLTFSGRDGQQVDIPLTGGRGEASTTASEPPYIPDGVEPPKKPARKPGGGTVLESTLIPGARQFAEQDVVPAARGAADMGRDIRDTLSPPSASPAAQVTADTVRNAKARIANAAAIESSKYADVAKHFSKFSDAENIGHITAYERTGSFPQAPAGYSAFYRQSMTDARALLQQAYGEDRIGLVENYVRRAFEFGSRADETKGTAYLSNTRASLSANTSPTKGRVLEMPLEAALADMKARGIKVKLAVANPELLRQWSVANARQAVAYADAWTQLKEGGLVEFVKPGGRVPEHAIPLDDRAARVFFPTDQGLVQAGQYFADPTVARVLNNTISKGLGGSATFRGVRTINNTLNQLQLGVSGFHFTGVAINAGVSDLALGLRQVGRGAKEIDLGRMGRGAARAAGSVVPFQSFARDLYHGRALIEGLKSGAPEAYAFLEETLNPAGGRLNIDTRYRNKAAENMVRAFRNQNYIGAALRVPLALVEQTAKPLMEYAIPRVKIGAFIDLAHDITERMPQASTAELHRAYAQAWDSIDNRFGQLVYDNLFWNKTAQDLAQVATRSVGWNLGTVRELGGGLTDVATQTLRGRGGSDRTLYTAALPIYVGAIGAAYQYLKTGEGPSDLKDYFYPKNGRTEPNGMVSRTTLPTYMKDVYAYSAHPIDTVAHKQSPLLELTGELVRNEDFFGTMIRNPEDPLAQQLEQVGAHVLRTALPFTVQQLNRTTEEGGNAEAQGESFLGFTKASAAVERSPAETLLHNYLGPATRRTPEERAAGQVRTDLRTAVKAGDVEQARTIIQQGQLTRRQLQNVARGARLTGLQAGFQRLGLDLALNVYEVATPQERGLLAPLLDLKVHRADVAPADVERVKAKVAKAVALPRLAPSAPSTPTAATRQPVPVAAAAAAEKSGQRSKATVPVAGREALKR
jgi:2'-5' RNA ligase